MSDSNQFTKERLNELRSLPLDMKVKITEALIREWYTYFYGKVAVSLSGGKDSTVLLDITRSIFPDVKAVFSNTGLEYPEIQSFVRKQENVDIIRPKQLFTDVISNYGYPIISKEVAEAIYYARRIVPKETTGNEREPLWRRFCLTGNIPDLRPDNGKKKNSIIRKALSGEANCSDGIQGTKPKPSHGSTSAYKRTELLGARERERHVISVQ